ncbi:MAG: hypothetical protein R3C11_09720 [Planctomycetaceae bacterium]
MSWGEMVPVKVRWLRIMAGQDTDFMGTVRPAKNIKIGYFEQEPQLDPEQTVEEAISRGGSKFSGDSRSL